MTWNVDSIAYAIGSWGLQKDAYIRYVEDSSKSSLYDCYCLMVDPQCGAFGTAYSGRTVYCAAGYWEDNYSTDAWSIKDTYDFPLNVSSDIMNQDINPGLPMEMAVGESIKPTVKLNYTQTSYGGTRDFTLRGTWTSSDSSVLSVSSDGTITAKGVGTAVLTYTSDGMTWSYGIETTSVAHIQMYRLYNPWSGEHLFTMNWDEVTNLVSPGWKNEGIAWYSPSFSHQPVYKLYNPYSGDHFYTGDKKEYDYLGSIGWSQEGEAFNSADSTGKPIYRLFNRLLTQGTHLFTTDASKYSYLGSIGWNREGVAFYSL